MNTPKFLIIILFCLTTACASTQRAPVASTDDSVTMQSEPTIRVMMPGKKKKMRVTELPLETYLAGVIGNEMSPKWPVEALKAQTVAARSYALYRMSDAKKEGRKFDVVTTQADQVFDLRDIKNTYLQDIVSKTRGQVLLKNGEVVAAYYSSTCGGKGRSAIDAELSKDSPLTCSVIDPYCKLTPFRSWVVLSDADDIAKRFKKIGIQVKSLKSISVQSKDSAGYVKSLSYVDAKGKHTLKGKDFRKAMGSMRVKSLLFNIITDSNGIIYVKGNGFGHGVGLCQYGAKIMATKGKKYTSILTKYYPNIPLKKIY